jgi:heptosyltransferase I
MSKKAVFIRLDKIGDLISTLPVDQLQGLHTSAQTYDIQWVISSGLGWIAKQAKPERKFLELSLKKEEWKKSYQQLLEFLKKEKPDAAVIFYAPWWASLACWQAGVPLRVGRKSQWHSFLFLNQGLRQSRTEATQHEADYNRELVEFAFGLTPTTTPFFQLQAEDSTRLLEKWNLQKKNYFVVHPGMFGSALNWPQKKYNELISELTKTSQVIITGTQNDERFLTEIKTAWSNHSQVRIAQDQLTMQELLSILKMAKGVIAPSTGVLHLAASLGVHAVGIYSPVQVHHPKRWGPRGPKATFVLPEILQNEKCHAIDHCLNMECQFYPCMETISVSQVSSLITSLSQQEIDKA